MHSSDDKPTVLLMNVANKASQSGALNSQVKWNAEPVEWDTKTVESSQATPEHSHHRESGNMAATASCSGLSASSTQSSSNRLPGVTTGEGIKFPSGAEAALRVGHFATSEDRYRAMDIMTLDQRRQYREAHAKKWGRPLLPLLESKGYDDGEDIEYETSTTSYFPPRPKGW